MRMNVRFLSAAAVLVCSVVASRCSSPTTPSPTETASSGWSQAQEGGLSLEDVVARGWDCRPSPVNPSRLSCVAPNQPHPASLAGPPPPADRPASFSLKVFDNGDFVGTNLLIRSDLYSNQPCRSTGGLYRFISRIGYYECLHPQGN